LALYATPNDVLQAMSGAANLLAQKLRGPSILASASLPAIPPLWTLAFYNKE